MIGECLTRNGADGFDPADWWGATDREILDCLKDHGAVRLDDLCEELGLTEGAATAFVTMLAREGRVRIRQVELVA